ncbi:MAG: hypothetical protein FJ267_18795, partial [Planctomycetes bacterium]|nr:hypothetical protein [Planctomycetota bacterium]
MTLGIGDGDDYSPDIGHRGQSRKLVNGRKSYDKQDSRLRYLQSQLGVPITPAARALPVFVGASHRDSIPFLVLRHSLIRRSSIPIRVSVLPSIPRRFGLLVRRGTPFSLARFQIPELMGHQGRALYLDSDMLVFDDIGALFATDLHDRAVGLTRVMSTPN